jgi:hypothetical protein
MAKRGFAQLALVLGAAAALGGSAERQTPDQRFQLIFETNESKIERALNEAGARGFVLIAAADYRFVLRRDEGTTHAYRVIEASRDSTLLKEINEAGDQGFRVLPHAVMSAGGSALVVLERQPQASKYTYVTVKGDDTADAAIDTARRSGATIVAVLGKEPSEFSLAFGGNPAPLLILEKGGPSAADDRDYRVVSTKLTGSLEKEIRAAGTEGFHAIGSAFMTVVLERADSEPQAREHRLVATTRASTAEREINALAAEGFRIVALPRAPKEWLFVMERRQVAEPRYQYVLATLEKKTLETTMGMTAGGHVRLIGLIEDVGIFEASPPSTTER